MKFSVRSSLFNVSGRSPQGQVFVIFALLFILLPSREASDGMFPAYQTCFMDVPRYEKQLHKLR